MKSSMGSASSTHKCKQTYKKARMDKSADAAITSELDNKTFDLSRLALPAWGIMSNVLTTTYSCIYSVERNKLSINKRSTYS